MLFTGILHSFLDKTEATKWSLPPGKVLLLVTVLVLSLSSCGKQEESPADAKALSSSSNEAVVDSGLAGKALVERHCTRCHSAPLPTDLPKELWPITLHGMGFYVGMHGDEFPDFTMEPKPIEPAMADYMTSYAITDENGDTHMSGGYTAFMLPEPLMSKAEWLRIRNYFESNALTRHEMYKRRLDEPALRDKAPVLKGFVPTVPKLDLEPNGWILSMAVDENRQRLYVGRAVEEIDWATGERLVDEYTFDELLAFDLRNGKRIGSAPAGTDPIHLETTKTGVRLGTYGVWPISINGPGLSQITDWDFDSEPPRGHMLVNGQQLLIEHHSRDLNGDGLDDLVLNAYGDGIFNLHGGELAVYWQTPDYAKRWQEAPAEIPVGHLEGALRHTVLADHVGIIGSAIDDFNNDGRPDIAVIVAQAKQQIIIFLNNGDETFQRTVVAEWRPSYGGISIETGDFDGDGHTDILALHGDNSNRNGVPTGTLTRPRSNHGIRLLKNNGDMSFTEQLFYPMDGAMRAVVTDFDADGDLDIAAIAFFPDWNREEPVTFVYLENWGNWQFKPATLAREYFGVWSSIAAADVNADGKPDIVLGLGNYPSMMPDDWLTREVMEGRDGKAPSVMYLLNNH